METSYREGGLISGAAMEALRQYNEAESPAVLASLEAEAAMKERLYWMPADVFRQGYVVLCSVWPERLVSEPFHHGGVARKRYVIEGGSPERPAYLMIENTFDWIQMQGPDNKAEFHQATIYAHQIAKDLIQYWTGDHPGNRRGKRGVGVISGALDRDTSTVTATPDEILELHKLQHSFLSYSVELADALWDSGNPVQRGKISREHRKAFAMLGLDEKQHPWVRTRVAAYLSCPACGERIRAEATVCKECKTNLIDYFMGEDLPIKEGDWPNVVLGIARRNARNSPPPIKSKKGDV